MAATNLTINAKFNLTTRFKKQLVDKIEAYFKKKESQIKKVATEVVQSEVQKAIQRNHVFNNLVNGEGKGQGLDLAAEFGLTPEEVPQKGQDIISILLTTVKVADGGLVIDRGGNDPRKAKVTLRVSFLNREDYYNTMIGDSRFSYVSTSKGSGTDGETGERIATTNSYQIPWMKWLLQANRGNKTIRESLVNISQFGILYDLTNAQTGRSRSGRAVMAQPKKKRIFAEFPYQYPEGAVPSFGEENFVAEIKNSELLNNTAHTRLKNAIKEILRRR